MFAGNWPDDHVATLRANFAAGMSFAENAADINGKHGTDYSRNACIGKAARIGLSQADKPKPQKAKPTQGVQVHHRKKRATPPIPPEQIMRRCAKVVTHNLTIYELSEGTCKWPYGDRAPYTFCGCKPFPGFPYCAEHAALSIGNGTESERSAHRMANA